MIKTKKIYLYIYEAIKEITITFTWALTPIAIIICKWFANSDDKLFGVYRFVSKSFELKFFFIDNCQMPKVFFY